MAITLSTGVVLSIATTYDAKDTFTAISNAAEAIVTMNPAHGLLVGDFVEVTSGWGLLNQRICRIKTVNVNDVTLEGVNTTSTTQFPASGGVGSGAGLRKIATWTTLSQVKSLSASGGDIQYANISSLEDVVAKQVPTIRNAVSMNIDVYDDPTLAWYSVVAAASDARAPVGLLMAFPNSSKLIANAYWSLQRVPTVAINEAMTSQISLSYAAEPVRYAA